MKYLVLKYLDKSYRQTECDDEYLEMLALIFNDGNGWTNAVKDILQDPNETGIFGNMSRIRKQGISIEISYNFGDEFDEDYIEIDRQVLLDLINKWQELVQKKVPEIYIIRHDDNGKIEISDRLPED